MTHEMHAWARKVLAAEELILASCTVDYNGTVQSDHARVDGALAGLAPDPRHAVPEPPDVEALVPFPTAARMDLLLTERRLLVFSVGPAGGRRFAGDVPLPALASIRLRAGVYGEQASIVMSSGAIVDVEHHGGDALDILVARLAELRADQRPVR